MNSFIVPETISPINNKKVLTVQYREVEFGTDESKITITLLDEMMEQGLVGMISSSMFKENIAIIISETPDDDDFSFACLGCGKEGKAPRVVIAKQLLDELKAGELVANVILMHEIGHYFNSDIGDNLDNNDDRRRELVSKNKVCPKEVKADAFAVKYLGKDTVIDGLQELQRRILIDFADYDEESVQITIKEINIRISRIEKTKEEKE